MQKQNGFTLIELVVVIIILGILAVTAAPKFINLQGDARVSALQGVKGALQGANSLYFSKAAIAGKEKEIGYTVESAVLNYGYIKADVDNIADALDITPTDWNITEVTPSNPGSAAGVINFQQKNAPADCKFTYTEAEDASTPPKYSTMPTADKC